MKVKIKDIILREKGESRCLTGWF